MRAGFAREPGLRGHATRQKRLRMRGFVWGLPRETGVLPECGGTEGGARQAHPLYDGAGRGKRPGPLSVRVRFAGQCGPFRNDLFHQVPHYAGRGPGHLCGSRSGLPDDGKRSSARRRRVPLRRWHSGPTALLDIPRFLGQRYGSRHRYAFERRRRRAGQRWRQQFSAGSRRVARAGRWAGDAHVRSCAADPVAIGVPADRRAGQLGPILRQPGE